MNSYNNLSRLLGEKFVRLESRLRSVSHELLSSYSDLEDQIANKSIFESESRLNQKRLELINLLDEKLVSLLRSKKNQLDYFIVDLQRSLIFFKVSYSKLDSFFGRVYFKNDLCVWKKINHFDLLVNQRRPVNLHKEEHTQINSQKWFPLALDRFLVYDFAKQHLAIINTDNGRCLQQISIKYKLIPVIEVLFSEKVVVIMNMGRFENRGSVIAVFDCNLNLLATKRVRFNLIDVLAIKEDHFKCFESTSGQIVAFSYELDILDYYTNFHEEPCVKTIKLDKNTVIFAQSKSKMVFKMIENGKNYLEVVSKNSADRAIKIELELGGIWPLFVDFDCEENLYMKVKQNVWEAFYVYCYDPKGCLRFKKSFPVLNNTTDFRIFDQKVMVFFSEPAQHRNQVQIL